MPLNVLRIMSVKSSADRIEHRAADWAARLDRGGLTGAEQVTLASWLAADTRHHGAFVRAQAALALLDCVREDRQPAPRVRFSPATSRRALLGGALAGAAACAVGGVVMLGEGRRFQTFATGAGEIRRLAFPGGAELVLDARSRVRAALAGGRQLVSLEAGRVSFDMRRGPTAPLTVEAGDLRLQSSRAAFSAAREAEKVDLVIAEGRVEAWNQDQEAVDHLVLRGGEEATLMRASLVRRASLTSDDLARAEAWKSGRLALDGESVAYAVAVFNRYNDTQIVITSPALEQQALVGYFYLNDPAGFVAALEASFDARARRSGARIVVG